MAFWNRNRNEPKPAPPVNAVERLTRVILDLRADVENLRREVDGLHIRVNGQPVPTNGQSRAGSVQEVLPIVDRLHELLLVEKGCIDVAREFGLVTRQREVRQSQLDGGEQEFDDEPGSGYEYV